MAKVSCDVMIPTETGYTIKKVNDNTPRDEKENSEEDFPDDVYTGDAEPKWSTYGYLDE